MNAARYSARLGAPTPVLFVCEDNGLGISVPTPRDWIRDSHQGRHHLRYVRAEGDLATVNDTIVAAVEHVRRRRTPVFLHLPTVRLWGHAGSDVEATYRTKQDIRASEDADPVVAMARWLLNRGAASADELATLVKVTRDRVRTLAEHHADAPHLSTSAQVSAALFDRCADAAGDADAAAAVEVSDADRLAAFGGSLPEGATQPGRRTMAAHLNATLTDIMLRRPETLVFGEDVGRKGGVYGVTGRLQAAFGNGRVFDTLLDETTILGTAQGAAMLGFLPIPEIQYLAYVHNALDQVRGEAASLAFFSDGQFTNPMVIRLAGLAYQRGFGGHFHNDNALGALRDIPSLVIAAPSRGDDAARLLRGCVALAKAQGRVVVFLEPIALYHERDLHEVGDGAWLSEHPGQGEVILPGQVGIHDQGPGHIEQVAPSLLLVSYANGVRMSRRVAMRLANDHDIAVRVLDVRWLLPLPHEAIRDHAERVGRVLVVDEARRTGGGIADEVVARLATSGFRGPLASVTSDDCFVPLGPAADTVLLDEARIMAAATDLLA
ncbi:MAG: 2-oxoisovalerate dehydrogenase E1 component [Glaciecola sp.]